MILTMSTLIRLKSDSRPIASLPVRTEEEIVWLEDSHNVKKPYRANKQRIPTKWFNSSPNEKLFPFNIWIINTTFETF